MCVRETEREKRPGGLGRAAKRRETSVASVACRLPSACVSLLRVCACIPSACVCISSASAPREQLASAPQHPHERRRAYVELLFGLRKALAVMGVDEEDNGVDLRKVVLPDLARNLVAAEVKRAELDLRNRELLGRCERTGRENGARRSEGEQPRRLQSALARAGSSSASCEFYA